MRTILLSAVAAVALCGAAVAQGQSGGGAAQQPPIMKAPTAPGAAGQRQGDAGAEGGTAVQEQPRRQDARQPSQEGDTTRQGATQRRQQTDQGAPRDTMQQRDQRQPARDTAQGEQDRTAQPQPRQEQAGQDRQNRPTASGNVSSRTRINISSPQQKTVIKNNIVRTSVRVPAGVTIAVGSVLPRTISFHPVPPAIVAVIPELEPYYYIVIDGQVVFVDPGTFEIVYIMSLA